MNIILDDVELLQKIKLADTVIKVVKEVLGDTPLNQRKEIERLDIDVLGDLNAYTRIGIAKQYFLEIADKRRARNRPCKKSRTPDLRVTIFVVGMTGISSIIGPRW